MFKLKVNDIDVEIEEGLTVLQACEKAGFEIQDFAIMKNYQLLETAECVWWKWKNHQNQ